ncbi:MAG: IS30 family transposase [Oleiphilaceae bacterium]|jgi:IS30 family transposase
MAANKRLTLATHFNVYFCESHSPWQRGFNENMNGLSRQYLPKRTNFSGYSQAKLNAVIQYLNDHPRKVLKFETTVQRFNLCVASTG